MSDFGITLISAIGVSGLTTAAIVFLAKTWISERLKRSIEHEYAAKLESHKAILRAEHETALEKLRADAAKDRAVQSAATTTLIGIHQAGQERRLNAVEILWQAIVDLKGKIPGIVTMADILPEEEYGQLLTQPSLRSMMDKLSFDLLNDILKGTISVEKIRPFLGQYVYAHFWAYRAFVSQVLFSLIHGRDEGRMTPWYHNDDIRSLLSTTFTTGELEGIERMPITRFTNLLNAFDSKILLHSGKIISGEESATFGLDQAERISAVAAKLEQKEGNP